MYVGAVEQVCFVCGSDLQRGHSGDGCLTLSILFKYARSRGHLFVLSWAGVREWYCVCDFVVLSVAEVCADYVGVNVFHVCLNFGGVYGVGVCVNVSGVVCVVVCCLFRMSWCCLLCCDVM